MERLCRSILGVEDIKYADNNPQDWYDTYKEHVQRLVALNSLEFVQQHYPKGSLILTHSSSADSNSNSNNPLQATQATDPAIALLLNMVELAKQGKILDFDFPTKFPVKTTNIETVENNWGKPDSTDYIASAKGTYVNYLSHNVAFGFNKGGQIFEVRSYDSQLKNITLTKVKEFFGTPPAYSTQYNGQWIFGYTAGAEFKIEFVFSPATTTNPDPGIDHYNVLYPQGTVNGMADDPGRQW